MLMHKPCLSGLAYAEYMCFDFKKIYDKCNQASYLIWLLHKSGNMTPRQAAVISLSFAKEVLPIYEKHKPSDMSPRKVIEQIEQLLFSSPVLVESREVHTADVCAAAYAITNDIADNAYLSYSVHTLAALKATLTVANAAITAINAITCKNTVYANKVVYAAVYTSSVYAIETIEAEYDTFDICDASIANNAARKKATIRLSNLIRETVPNPFN